jgi:lysozyme
MITPDQVDPILMSRLRTEEGKRNVAYQDTLGVWTIGEGHTGPEVVPGLVWTDQQCDDQFRIDIADHCNQLEQALPWTDQLDPVRLRVLQDMTFNMGVYHLLAFHNTLSACQRGDYDATADGMEASLWAKEVGQRAQTLADIMRSGVDPS